MLRLAVRQPALLRYKHVDTSKLTSGRRKLLPLLPGHLFLVLVVFITVRLVIAILLTVALLAAVRFFAVLFIVSLLARSFRRNSLTQFWRDYGICPEHGRVAGCARIRLGITLVPAVPAAVCSLLDRASSAADRRHPRAAVRLAGIVLVLQLFLLRLVKADCARSAVLHLGSDLIDSQKTRGVGSIPILAQLRHERHA